MQIQKKAVPLQRVMDSSVISLALTAYAVYNAIRQSSSAEKQAELEARLSDVVKDTNILTEKVNQADKNPELLDKNLQVNYLLRVGRPTSMNKISMQLDLTITNKSTTTPYTIDAVAVMPTIGVTFGNTARSRHFFADKELFPITLAPGHHCSFSWAFNNVIYDPAIRNNVFDAILKEFNDAGFRWSKLSNEKGELENGVSATVMIRAYASYLGTMTRYVVKKTDVEGTLRWVGGLFNVKDSGFTNFDRMVEIFENKE